MYHLPPGVDDAHDPEQHAEEDDKVVVGLLARRHQVALQLEVEVARPHEGEHGPGERSDQPHQHVEVGDGDCAEYGEDDQPDA